MRLVTPEKTHVLGGPLPPIPQRVVSWPWGPTPHLTGWSLEMLKLPLGTLIYDVVDGRPVLAQIQTHFSYGAHPDWPERAHKGTSVFVPVTADPSTGHTVPMHDAPEGWGDAASMGFDWWIPAALGLGGVGGFYTGATAVAYGMGSWLREHHPDVLQEFKQPRFQGEMYTKKRHGGYRFSGEPHPEPFSARQRGMMY